MSRIIIIIFFISNLCIAQTEEIFLNKFLLESELENENKLGKYKQFDFSEIWMKTENYNVLGIIGKEHQRIQIKIISVKKNKNTYKVTGKSLVNGTICDFTGQIKINSIKEVKELHYGVDMKYADKGIKSQGVLFAEYEFKENNSQNHSGVFNGKLYTKWYLNSNNKIEYDFIESMSDEYINNAFIGTWKSYTSGKEKLCNWGDFRVPLSNNDFDIGAGEFSPSKKYYEKGWSDYKSMEVEKWWK